MATRKPRQFVLLPRVGDVVLCRFPYVESPGQPGGVRPALVVRVGLAADKSYRVEVAYGTGQRNPGVNRDIAGHELYVGPEDAQAFKQSGLNDPTKFDLARRHELPWTEDWFAASEYSRFRKSPKIGSLAPVHAVAASQKLTALAKR